MKIQEFRNIIKEGTGRPFYFFLIISFLSTFIFWGKNDDLLFGKLSQAFCANLIEWLFLTLYFPMIAWFYTRKEKHDRWKEYKKKTIFSGRLAQFLIKKRKPIIAQQFAHRELGLDDIQIYLKLLTEYGVLREIPGGQNEFIYLSNEAPIKKPPFKLNRYMRSTPHLLISAIFSVLVFYFFSYLFANTTLMGSKGNNSFLASWIGQKILGSFPPINSLNIMLWILLSIFLLILIWQFETFLIRKWKSFQDIHRQKKLIHLARRNKGKVNSSSVCLALGLPLHKAKEYLDFLQQKGFAQIDFDENGYSFHRIAI